MQEEDRRKHKEIQQEVSQSLRIIQREQGIKYIRGRIQKLIRYNFKRLSVYTPNDIL